jgi:hypothetical protein
VEGQKEGHGAIPYEDDRQGNQIPYGYCIALLQGWMPVLPLEEGSHSKREQIILLLQGGP